MRQPPISLRRRPRLRKARTVRRGTAVMALALASVSAIAGCGGSSDSARDAVGTVPEVAAGSDPLAPQPLSERATVTVGLSTKLEVYLPILLAQEFGEFEKENLEVKVEYMPPTDSALLLTQRKLDVVYSAFTAGMFNLMSNNEDLRFAFPGPVNVSPDQGVYGTTPRFGGPEDVEGSDFKGAKFVVSSGSAGSSAYFIWKYATGLRGGEDLAPTDITFENIDLPEVPLTLRSGAADGGQVISPYHTELAGDPCCFVLEGAYPDRPQTGYVVGPSLSDRKDVALALFRAMARTQATYLQGDYHANSEVLAAMAKVMEQSEEALVKGRALRFDTQLETNTEILGDLQKFYREFGDLSYPEDLPDDAIYDQEYINALRASS